MKFVTEFEKRLKQWLYRTSGPGSPSAALSEPDDDGPFSNACHGFSSDQDTFTAVNAFFHTCPSPSSISAGRPRRTCIMACCPRLSHGPRTCHGSPCRHIPGSYGSGISQDSLWSPGRAAPCDARCIRACRGIPRTARRLPASCLFCMRPCTSATASTCRTLSPIPVPLGSLQPCCHGQLPTQKDTAAAVPLQCERKKFSIP